MTQREPTLPATTAHTAETWRELEARIEEVGRSLAAGVTVSAEQTRIVLARRAGALAVPLARESGEARTELLAMERGGRRYSLETRYIAAIVRNAPTAPLPGAEPPVTAVAAWRGRLLTTLDFGSSGGAVQAPFLIVLGEERAEIGLMADAIGEISSIAVNQLRDVPDGPMRWRDYVRVLTADSTPLIDGELLLKRHAIDR